MFLKKILLYTKLRYTKLWLNCCTKVVLVSFSCPIPVSMGTSWVTPRNLVLVHFCTIRKYKEVLESVMYDIIKIHIKRRIATRSGKGNQPLIIKTAVERPIVKLGLPNLRWSFHLFYFSLHPSFLDVFLWRQTWHFPALREFARFWHVTFLNVLAWNRRRNA